MRATLLNPWEDRGRYRLSPPRSSAEEGGPGGSVPPHATAVADSVRRNASRSLAGMLNYLGLARHAGSFFEAAAGAYASEAPDPYLPRERFREGWVR